MAVIELCFAPARGVDGGGRRCVLESTSLMKEWDANDDEEEGS